MTDLNLPVTHISVISTWLSRMLNSARKEEILVGYIKGKSKAIDFVQNSTKNLILFSVKIKISLCDKLYNGK